MFPVVTGCSWLHNDQLRRCFRKGRVSWIRSLWRNRIAFVKPAACVVGRDGKFLVWLTISCLIHAWPVLFQVFRAVESWISHKSDRADYFPSLMKCVRLPLLPKPFVRSLLESNDLVLAEHRVQAVMRDLLQVSDWRLRLFDSEKQ